MVAKLKRLPVATQEALQRFACVGHSATVAILAIVQGGSAEAVHADLWEALREGLVSRRSDSYGFLHDRVQEAAYALIPEPRRPEAHVQIGRRLLARPPQEAVNDRVFEIVNQLNRGVALITDLSERDTLRQLNAQAGRRAKHATAYAAARGYLHQATALLRPEAWRTQYEETFTVYLERCECEYLTGHFDVAQDLSRLMLENARSDLDRAQVYRLRIRLSQLAGRPADVLTALREALQLFGITWPESTVDIQAASEAEHRAVAINLRGRRVTELVDAPAATDPTVQMLISLIAESLFVASGWTVQHSYFPWLATRGINVCLRHGHTAESSSLYEGYARAGDCGGFAVGLRIFGPGAPSGREVRQPAPAGDCALSSWLLYQPVAQSHRDEPARSASELCRFGAGGRCLVRWLCGGQRSGAVPREGRPAGRCRGDVPHVRAYRHPESQ